MAEPKFSLRLNQLKAITNSGNKCFDENFVASQYIGVCLSLHEASFDANALRAHKLIFYSRFSEQLAIIHFAFFNIFFSFNPLNFTISFDFPTTPCSATADISRFDVFKPSCTVELAQLIIFSSQFLEFISVAA